MRIIKPSAFDGMREVAGLVPRLVDHEVRRRQITDAARRVIVGGGLDAVTFQSVAAEAGFSVRLVQYYFGTKREFLLATHRSVMADAGARFARRWAELGEQAAPRAALRALFEELLPLDEQRREEEIVLGAFNTAAIAGQGISSEETLAAPRALLMLIGEQLKRANATSVELDAQLMVAALGGLAQGVLSGYADPGRAVELAEHILDRVLGPEIGDNGGGAD
ncbi:TetR/AcrR family transcriptional regulator [Nocardia callitridis]|uniref:TetR/AcrR family transcriptional regulator n=1 Tax=Nocardia callitridis TaxID=648753 RepID=UPI0031ED086A